MGVQACERDSWHVTDCGSLRRASWPSSCAGIPRYFQVSEVGEVDSDCTPAQVSILTDWTIRSTGSEFWVEMPFHDVSCDCPYIAKLHTLKTGSRKECATWAHGASSAHRRRPHLCPLVQLSTMAFLLCSLPCVRRALAVIAQPVNKKPFVSSGTQSSSCWGAV